MHPIFSLLSLNNVFCLQDSARISISLDVFTLLAGQGFTDPGITEVLDEFGWDTARATFEYGEWPDADMVRTISATLDHIIDSVFSPPSAPPPPPREALLSTRLSISKER